MSKLQLDRYGGWTGMKFEATGYFHLEQDDRWWLVSPEGNAFLSFGINHLHPHFWQGEHSRTAWQKKLGVNDLHGPAFEPALREWYLEACRRYRFNTAGVHTELPILNTPQPAMPYMRPIHFVDIPHWKTDIPGENFLDVYSKAFATRCDRMAKEAAEPARNDPYLLAYTMTDCPLFTEEDCRERPDVVGGARREVRIGWPRRLRNLDGEAAGKKAYVETVREIYRGEISAFNTIYGTVFDSFDALSAAEDWRPKTDLSNVNETRDNTVFLQKTVDKYYQTARDAIFRYDPYHMFFGDKINANTDSMEVLLPVITRYTDVVFYQMYAKYAVQKPGMDRWSQRSGKPLFNGDSAYTMITPHMPRPYGPVADNLAQRTEWTVEFFQSAFARPDFVGWHYCGLIDATNQLPDRIYRQHSGLHDEYGEPYPELLEALQSCADGMYARHNNR